jgi:hypothetical protein
MLTKLAAKEPSVYKQPSDWQYFYIFFKSPSQAGPDCAQHHDLRTYYLTVQGTNVSSVNVTGTAIW